MLGTAADEWCVPGGLVEKGNESASLGTFWFMSTAEHRRVLAVRIDKKERAKSPFTDEPFTRYHITTTYISGYTARMLAPGQEYWDKLVNQWELTPTTEEKYHFLLNVQTSSEPTF